MYDNLKMHTQLANYLYQKLNLLTISFIIFYTIIALIVSLNRFWQSQVFFFDFGIFDSAIWSVSRFQAPMVDHFYTSDQKVNILGTHFYPGIFLLSPLYWFTDKSEVLLIVQSLSVGIAAFFAFDIARNQIKNKFAILALIIAFLGYQGMQNALISEFHEATIAVLPLTIIFWSLFKKKWTTFFLAFFILLSLKESFALLGIILGFYIFYRVKNRKIGIIISLISIIWAVTTIKFVIPWFAGGSYLYVPQDTFTSATDVLNIFFSPPMKMQTVLYTFLTFGFLPLMDLAILPLIFESFLERFILDGSTRWDLGMHYNSPLSPLMFIGALYAFKLAEKKKFPQILIAVYAIFIIITIVFLHRFWLRGPLQLAFNPAFYAQNQSVKYLADFSKQFPKSGVIMTQNDIAARLSHYDVYLLRENYIKLDPDYVILNLTPGQNGNSYHPIGLDKTLKLKNMLINDSKYDLKKYGEELYIFAKKHPQS